MKKKKKPKENNIYTEEELFPEFAYITGYFGDIPYGITIDELELETDNEERNNQIIINYEDENSKVVLSELVEKFNEVSKEFDIFLNIKTGEYNFFPASDPFILDYSELDEQSAMIYCSDDYYKLPTPYELYEREIMVEFAHEFPDSKTSKELLKILKQKGSFRRFKDSIKSRGIAKDYYLYREKIYFEKAKLWCIENSITYKIKKDDEYL